MKRLVILGAIWALAVAKPGLYKEKEDFQFSRSSSDDGTKSGYYGAQRGNMGGNYERAHNMDSLAQNQMGGLVRQVEGELGDGARQRTGSVYTAANSRGTYGSGRYDLSNLGGRNFQEGTSYGDAQSQSSQSASSAYNAAGYTDSQSQNSRHSGYQATGYSGLATGHSGLATGYSGLATGQSGLATGHSALNLQSDDLQALDHTQGAGQYDYGRQTSHAAGYNTQSGYQQHAAYDTSNTNLHSGGYGSNVQTRLISATPVRIIVRPGTRVTIPVAAQTYDLTHGSSLIDQNSLNSEAEVLSNDNQRTVYRPSNAKHYESSYNYRKEWEKHDTVPATVISTTSTDNPFPKNSELYEDSQARTANGQYDTRRVDSQRTHSAYGGYNANVKSTSGQSRFNYDTQRNGASFTNANAYSVAGHGATHEETSSDSSLNANAYSIQSQYDAGRYHGASSDALRQAAGLHNTGYNAAADFNSQVEDSSSKPKSYQSAYSYHKSWERQGDPYVIKPASGAYYDGQSSSQRLTTGSAQNLGYSSTGSHYQHSHASGADCDENGHIRVARSYNTDQFQETQQQSQNLEDFGQQQQSQNLEDFGQQQQSQNLEDFGQQQQSQNLEDFGQQQQSQNLEDFGQQQQTQNLEDFSQQQQSQNLDYFGQQQQSQNVENFVQQQHKHNLEDLGHRVDNVGQQVEVVWDSQSEQEGGQQAEKARDSLESLGQQLQKKEDDIDHTWDKFEDVGQKPQDIEKQLPNVEQNNQNGHGPRTGTETEKQYTREGQQTQDKRSFNQQSQNNQKNINTQDKYDEQSNKFNQQDTQPQLSDDGTFNFFQQSQKHNNDQMSVWDKFDIGSDQNTQQNKNNSGHTNSNGNQVSWSLVPQQTGLDQQSNAGSKPEKPQSVEHNENNGSTVEQTTGNIQQPHNIPETNEQSNPGYFNLNNEHVNTHTNQNQLRNEENSFQETHKLQQSSDWYWSNNHRQDQTTNTDSYYNVNAFDTISPNTAPLSSLWNKLGNFEQTLLPDNMDKGAAGSSFSQVQTSTQNSYGNSMHAYNNMESTSQEHLNSQNMKPYQDLLHFMEKDTIQNNSDLSRVTEKDTSQNKSIETKSETESSFDVGRGDIGPEDLLDLKPVSSETIQNRDENSEKNNTNAQHYNQDVQLHETTQGQTNIHELDFQEQQDVQNTEEQNPHVFSLHENIEQSHTQDSKKQHHLEQHNVQDYEKSSEQKNTQAFAQQENVEQINLHEFEKQDNLEQHNLQDFGKDSNLEQVNLEQPNLHDFGQQVNLEQQNLHDFGKQDNSEQLNLQDFMQQVNVDQQNLQDFGKQGNLEQQNLQDFGKQGNLEQQNLQDFGKQGNLEQQNLQDFGQEVNSEQQNLNDFGKQVNVDQKNLHDFGKQVNVDQQNLHDFGKQDNLEQQNLQDFGQQVNVDQQNLHDFGKQDNLEQQNLQDFGQQVNVDQQNLHDFGKQDNLEQQNLQDFGQQVNVDQQNLHDFGKQDNLEQQNLQDFGQQVNLEQQNNVHDFGQQENLEQQNLQGFGNQDNLEQQSLQDFGQKAYLDQHNLEHIVSQDNLQQQNKNQEHFIEDLEQYLKYSKQTGLQKNNEQSQNYLPLPPKVFEQPIVKKQVNDLQSATAQTPSTEESPIEPVTEPTGFWKSFGNKFSSAKSKIASWF